MNILSMGDRPNPCNLVEYSGFIRFVNISVVNDLDWDEFINCWKAEVYVDILRVKKSTSKTQSDLVNQSIAPFLSISAETTDPDRLSQIEQHSVVTSPSDYPLLLKIDSDWRQKDTAIESEYLSLKYFCTTTFRCTSCTLCG